MTTAKQLSRKISKMLEEEKDVIAYMIQISDNKETNNLHNFKTNKLGAILGFTSTLAEMNNEWWKLMEKRGVLGKAKKK